MVWHPVGSHPTSCILHGELDIVAIGRRLPSPCGQGTRDFLRLPGQTRLWTTDIQGLLAWCLHLPAVSLPSPFCAGYSRSYTAHAYIYNLFACARFAIRTLTVPTTTGCAPGLRSASEWAIWEVCAPLICMSVPYSTNHGIVGQWHWCKSVNGPCPIRNAWRAVL